MKSQFLSFCGLAAVLGGALFLLIIAFGETNLENTAIWSFMPLLPALLTFGAVGLYTFSGPNGVARAMLLIVSIGTAAMTLGFALMVWLNTEEGWMVMVLGILIMTLGLLLFGLVNWRGHVLPRWNWLPLVIGVVTTAVLLPGILGVPIGGTGNELGFYLVFGAIGAGWILLGVIILLDGHAPSLTLTMLTTLFGLSLLLAACQTNSTEPRVRFSEPANNGSVSSPVRVVMTAENFTIEPAGEVHDAAGHLHIMVDTSCLPAGEVIPSDETHLHLGDGSRETELELATGEHTLCLQAADGAHTALAGDGMTHTITINVP